MARTRTVAEQARSEKQEKILAAAASVFASKGYFGAREEMATNWILSRRQYRLADMAPIVADLFVRGMLAEGAAGGRSR